MLPLVLVAFGVYGLLRSPYLTVQAVRVSETETLDQAAIAEISNLKGSSILDLPLGQARATLLEIPQIKSVRFERRWPRTVVIHVEERTPYALWSIGGVDYAVDQEGVVLASGAPSGPAPRIIDVDSARILGPGDLVHPEALALADRIFREAPRFLGQPVKELEFRESIGVIAIFSNGMRVTFGDDRSYDYKVAVLNKLLEQLKTRGTPVYAVDLRFGERVTYE